MLFLKALSYLVAKDVHWKEIKKFTNLQIGTKIMNHSNWNDEKIQRHRTKKDSEQQINVVKAKKYRVVIIK